MATDGEVKLEVPTPADVENHANYMKLAQTFSTSAECFGLIHAFKAYERPQLVLLCQLGIEQARLLAWGDFMGVAERCAANRDARLDNPKYRPGIEKTLQAMIDRPSHDNRVAQFEKFGLRPPKRTWTRYEPALDGTRLEVFREKFEFLSGQRWEIKRGMNIPSHHWQIVDNGKFKAYVAIVRENVNTLIGMMGNEDHINRAVKHDIRSLGWHPIFDKLKASSDSAKLRLIREACQGTYPEFSAITDGALDYIDREWKDNFEEIKTSTYAGRGSEIPFAAAKVQEKAAKESKQNEAAAAKERRPSMFASFRNSLRRNSKDVGGHRPSRSGSDAMPDPARSQSADASVNPMHDHSEGTGTGQSLEPPEIPERSKSIQHIHMREPSTDENSAPIFAPIFSAGGDDKAFNGEKKDNAADTGVPAHESGTEDSATPVIDFGEDLTKVPTADSVDGVAIDQITSMISRHDQWKAIV